MRLLFVLFFHFNVLMAFTEPLMKFEELYVEVDGAELYCRAIGEGDPIIIMHGGPGLMHDYLYPALSQLAETNLLVFYDQRGTGRSTGEINKENIRIDRFVDDLEAVRQAFNFEKVTLVGHSFGALLSVKYAMKYEESVENLVLINTAPLSMEGFVKYGLRVAMNKAPFSREFKAIEESEEFLAGDPSVLEDYAKLMSRVSSYDSKGFEFNFPISLKILRDHEKVFSIFTSEVFSKDFNWFSSLNKFQFPVLIMHGIVDSVAIEVAEEIHRNVHGSHLIKFEKAGHYIPNEQPQEMLKCIQRFLFSR
jgi:proline iminopeptidase